MAKLYKKANGELEIHTYSNGAFEGPRQAMIQLCVETLNMSPEGISDALREMDINGHDGAEFGVNGTYMFTFPRKTRS